MIRTSTIKAGAPMKRSGFDPNNAIKGTGFLGLRRKIAGKIASRGLKGRPPTIAEKTFMDAIASLGCLACLKDGRVNPWISIHHIDGRVKEGAHFLTLPLCGPHHQQDDTDPMQRVSLHGRKETFTKRYGTELELLAEAKQKLGLA
jgi:hypothetical protein